MEETKKRVQFATSIDKTLRDSLIELSKQTRIPQSKLMDEAIEDLLEKHGYTDTEKEAH